MHIIEKDISIKQKFGKNLYKDTIIKLVFAFAFFYSTKAKFDNNILGLVYFFLGMFITFMLTLPSKANPKKSIYNSLRFMLEKTNGTVKSIDKIKMIKNKNKKILKKSTLNFVDFLKFTDYDFIEIKNNYFVEILEIEACNLANMTYEDIDTLIEDNQAFYVAYQKDIKLIYLTYYPSFFNEIENINKILEEEKDPFKRYFLKEKIREFEIIEQEERKVYYICIYGNSINDLKDNIIAFNFSFPLKTRMIDRKTKTNIYYKLNNMNSNFKG